MIPANLKALKERFPKVLNKIEKAFQLFPKEKRLEWSKDEHGRLNIAYIREESREGIYGQVDTQATIERWWKGLKKPENALWVLTGFGLGYTPEKILNAEEFDGYLIVIEKDPLVLKEVLEKIDCSRILNNPYFFLTTGERDPAFFTSLKDVHFFNLESWEKVIFAPVYNMDADYYEMVWEEFPKHFNAWYSQYRTNLKDGLLLQKNIYTNFVNLIEKPDIKVLKPLWERRPAIIVAAGPSLDEAIDFIREAQEYAWIICVNTAYRKVTRAGIKPHITIAIDPRESTYLGYENISVEDTALVCSYYVHPKVVDYFHSRPCFTYAGENPFVRYLYEFTQRKDYTAVIIERGTITVTAVGFCGILGANEIYFVGQDLAYTETGQSHTKDSIYFDHKSLFRDISNCLRVPGNQGCSVPTDSRFISYKKTLEEIIALFPNVNFFNLSRLGAKIEKADYIDYLTALEQCKKVGKHKASPQLAIQQIYKKYPLNEKIRAKSGIILERLKKFVHVLTQESLLAALNTEKLMSQSLSEGEKNTLLAQSERDSRRVNHIIDNNLEEYKVVFDGALKSELVQYNHFIRKLKEPANALERAVQNREYFWALANGASAFLQLIRLKVD